MGKAIPPGYFSAEGPGENKSYMKFHSIKNLKIRRKYPAISTWNPDDARYFESKGRMASGRICPHGQFKA
jgi:hypothetical protein